jgi:hypothetical protein
MNISRLFGIPGKSLFTICSSFLKEYRNQSCGANAKHSSGAMSTFCNSDSDDNRFASNKAQILPSHKQPSLHHSNNSDDSNGLMNDDNAVSRNSCPRPRAPSPKRRQIGNGSNHRSRNEYSRAKVPVICSIDTRGAWSCSSLMLILQPCFQSAEFIASHLVWPEDFNNQAGYGICLTRLTHMKPSSVQHYCVKSRSF